MKLPKISAKNLAFAAALIALLIVAWRHSDAAVAVVTGALSIIAGVAGLPLLTGG